MTIEDKIKLEMDALQRMMESEEHLSDCDKVLVQYERCKRLFGHMREEDADYLNCVSVAIEERLHWRV
jgi:hypothetical protein